MLPIVMTSASGWKLRSVISSDVLISAGQFRSFFCLAAFNALIRSSSSSSASFLAGSSSSESSKESSPESEPSKNGFSLVLDEPASSPTSAMSSASVPSELTLKHNVGSRLLTWLPFGMGPRHCVGMRLAILELKMAIVRTLSVTRATNAKPDILEVLDVTSILQPTQPILIQFERRNKIDNVTKRPS